MIFALVLVVSVLGPYAQSFTNQVGWLNCVWDRTLNSKVTHVRVSHTIRACFTFLQKVYRALQEYKSVESCQNERHRSARSSWRRVGGDVDHLPSCAAIKLWCFQKHQDGLPVHMLSLKIKLLSTVIVIIWNVEGPWILFCWIQFVTLCWRDCVDVRELHLMEGGQGYICRTFRIWTPQGRWIMSWLIQFVTLCWRDCLESVI
jgi:hypothetical protein